MAQILDRSKVSEGLFDALYHVLGPLRGGLGMAVIVVSTVFAATTGIIRASVVAMGLMAGPALLRRGYQLGLGSGIICSSGTLGILIPPSIMLVIYGGLTGLKETSVGNLSKPIDELLFVLLNPSSLKDKGKCHVMSPPEQRPERKLFFPRIETGKVQILIRKIFQMFAFDELKGFQCERFWG